MIETATNIDRLREIALDQHGFVTYRQALDAGVTQPALAKLLSRGRLERAAHGVYRVPQIPASPYDQFMRAVLWTGAPEACLSHDSALDAHGVSDINPVVIHITVKKSRRISRKGGETYILHHCDLKPEQITWWEEIPVVTLPTAIEQGIDSGIPTYLLRQAIEKGIRQGKVFPAERESLLEMLELRDV
jgi:predicted transcriptional regulator of viral defense system